MRKLIIILSFLAPIFLLAEVQAAVFIEYQEKVFFKQNGATLNFSYLTRDSSFTLFEGSSANPNPRELYNSPSASSTGQSIVQRLAQGREWGIASDKNDPVAFSKPDSRNNIEIGETSPFTSIPGNSALILNDTTKTDSIGALISLGVSEQEMNKAIASASGGMAQREFIASLMAILSERDFSNAQQYQEWARNGNLEIAPQVVKPLSCGRDLNTQHIFFNLVNCSSTVRYQLTSR